MTAYLGRISGTPGSALKYEYNARSSLSLRFENEGMYVTGCPEELPQPLTL
jgi:hypothetical protein